MRILFILPGRGGGGGSHSVVQESVRLSQLGVDVTIATTTAAHQAFITNYAELLGNGAQCAAYETDEELLGFIEGANLAIATTALSAVKLADLQPRFASSPVRVGYYIQDYEPLFFTPGGADWAAARASYDRLKDALFFAKTDWLCRIVSLNHNREVVRVKPSIDHAVYHPGPGGAESRLSISAMVRPKTMRRAPRRTVRILERIAATYGDRVSVSCFGCAPEDLTNSAIRMSPAIEKFGVLSRQQVAGVLRSSHLFLDLSDYQAFGRTGLEGMACGCVPVLPVFGGADEYAVDRVNAFVVDPRDDEAIMKAVDDFVEQSSASRAAMRSEAIATSLNYSIEQAAFSELKAFEAFLR